MLPLSKEIAQVGLVVRRRVMRAVARPLGRAYCARWTPSLTVGLLPASPPEGPPARLRPLSLNALTHSLH
jgi:hypothetical protein